MTKTEKELAIRAQQCGLVLQHEPGSPDYYVVGFDGCTVGPFKPANLRIWLSGFRWGMNAHAPDCQCGRVACNHRNLIRSGAVEFLKKHKVVL